MILNICLVKFESRRFVFLMLALAHQQSLILIDVWNDFLFNSPATNVIIIIIFFWQIIFERNINIDTIVFNKVAVFVIDLVKSECE